MTYHNELNLLDCPNDSLRGSSLHHIASTVGGPHDVQLIAGHDRSVMSTDIYAIGWSILCLLVHTS